MVTSKKNIFILPILLLVHTFCISQIVTSKKEAEKKGIYQKPLEKKKTEVVEKSSFEMKNKEIKNSKSISPKSLKKIINEKEDDDIVLTPTENYLASQLINNAMQFIGVRYRGGGTTTSGMDCSGMVTAVFNIFDLKLPRSSNDMSRFGQKREKKDAQKGDLIFFRTNGRSVINHVGVVVDVINDEIKFIHSSSSNGVMVSSTKENYYKRAFAQVNKVLTN